jgi:hypothetical protein
MTTFKRYSDTLNTLDRIEMSESGTIYVDFCDPSGNEIVGIEVFGDGYAKVRYSQALPSNNWRDACFAYKRLEEFMIRHSLVDTRSRPCQR